MCLVLFIAPLIFFYLFVLKLFLQGFTNFVPRFAIRTICNLLDSEIVKIRNMEEAKTVYGKNEQYLLLFFDKMCLLKLF